MGRQWRIEFEGALYHVLSRGNDGKPIFSDNTDRIGFLNLLGDLCERFEIDMFAYVLMPVYGSLSAPIKDSVRYWYVTLSAGMDYNIFLSGLVEYT